MLHVQAYSTRTHEHDALVPPNGIAGEVEVRDPQLRQRYNHHTADSPSSVALPIVYFAAARGVSIPVL